MTKQLTLLVEENPSTGYSWVVVSKINADVDEQGSYVPGLVQSPDTPPGQLLVGGGGQRYLHVYIFDNNDYKVELHLRHPWDPTSTVDEIVLQSRNHMDDE